MRKTSGDDRDHIRMKRDMSVIENQISVPVSADADLKKIMEMQIIDLIAVLSDPALPQERENTLFLGNVIVPQFYFLFLALR